MPDQAMPNSGPQPTIARADPRDPALDLLFRRHHDFCHADTPPDSIHMMDRGALADEGAALFVLRDAGGPVAMGAIKEIAPGHGEIKSMHVLDEARGSGHARRLVAHLLTAAREMGLHRLSLETGAQPSFAAARALYAAAGFEETGPFAGYRPDPMSCFMTRAL